MQLTVDALKNKTFMSNADTGISTADAICLDNFPEHLSLSLENKRIEILAETSRFLKKSPRGIFQVEKQKGVSFSFFHFSAACCV